MANKQIKDLPLKSNPATDDQLAIDDSGGSTKKITVGSLPGENNRTLDAEPTDGNTANSVSSDGVFDALAGKSDTNHHHDDDYSALSHEHEGTAIKSTGETGGTKFLREDGDGTCSWQTVAGGGGGEANVCLLYTSPSPRDLSTSRMPSSA